MAQDWEQKSVQGIADPTKRKQAYYKLQREVDEDTQNNSELKKINNKIGRKSDLMRKGNTQPQLESMTGLAAGFTPLGRAAGAIKGAASLVPKAAEIGEAVNGLASRAEGALSGVEDTARQWLGKAKPVAQRLTGSASRVEGKAQKALGSRSYELKGGGTTKPSAGTAKDWKGGEIGSKGLKRKPQLAPRASNTKARMTEALTRPKGYQTPSAAKAQFAKGSRKVSDGLSEPSGAREKARTPRDGDSETAKMNQQAAKQNPRSRAMRSNEALGKPGSGKKGSYKPAKLKARDKVGS